jgi:hypothetical protein
MNCVESGGRIEQDEDILEGITVYYIICWNSPSINSTERSAGGLFFLVKARAERLKTRHAHHKADSRRRIRLRHCALVQILGTMCQGGM